MTAMESTPMRAWFLAGRHTRPAMYPRGVRRSKKDAAAAKRCQRHLTAPQIRCHLSVQQPLMPQTELPRITGMRD